MKFSTYWALLSSLLSANFVLGVVDISQAHQLTKLPGSAVNGQFIVEVATSADIPTRRSSETHLDAVYRSFKERSIAFDVIKEFNAAGLFVGAAVKITSAQDVAAILETPGVVAIRPILRFASPKPVLSHVVTGPTDSLVPADSESTHILTGVDKLHAQGIIGTGIKIGIIDTGIDYTHPSLGGGIGPGHKVIGGFDFVGDAYNGSNTPVPDNDPLDQCNGHGTHVGGIIGANPGNEFNISGVAFGASITAYRIFGCTGDVTDDIIVEALLRGVSEGQDILTMSLGGADGWTEATSSVVSSRIAASGKIVTIAAGNDGAFGSWYTSGPGNGINAISVASLDNTVIPLQNATVGGVVHDPITYFATFALPVLGSLPIFATSTDTTIVDDACDPLPDSTPDLSKFLVVVRRGTCTFVQKLTNVAAKGGLTTFIYDNGNGFEGISVGNFTAVLIQAPDGEFLVNQFVAKAPITISFPQVGGAFNFPDTATGGLISSFTSYGPSNDFFFKPAVAAPGGNILSTFPVPLGSFAVLSGTSMATPFVAASSALLFNVKGKTAAVATGARTLFETTAQKVPSSKTDGDPLQTLTQQGAGLINVFNAVHATTIVSPGELILNDTANFKPVQTFTVKNTDKVPKTFKLQHVPAGTALTVQSGTIFASDGPVPLSSTAASVVFSPSKFTVFPGQTQTVVAVFKAPTGIDKSTFPVFSGFIDVVGSSVAETFSVSYLGLAGSLKDKQVIDNTDVFFGVPLPTLLDSQGNVQDGPLNFTFVNGDGPTLLWRLAFGTPSFRADLVSSKINFNPTITSRGFGGSPFFSFPSPHNGGSFAQVKIVGPLTSFDFITRNDDDTTATGNGFNSLFLSTPTFANGSTVANGQYRVLVRALRVTGDPTNEADYESWLSPIVGITVPPS